MTDELLIHLYRLALAHDGEIHASSDEVALCFPSLPEPESPKRQADEPWPTTPDSRPAPASTMTTPTSADTERRRTVLNDMNQFLQEQEMNRRNQSLYEDGRKQPQFTTGDLPYRNYPEGRPPRRSR